MTCCQCLREIPTDLDGQRKASLLKIILCLKPYFHQGVIKTEKEEVGSWDERQSFDHHHFEVRKFEKLRVDFFKLIFL